MEDKSKPNPDWVNAPYEAFEFTFQSGGWVSKKITAKAVINPEWLALEGKSYGVLLIDPSMRPYECVKEIPPSEE